MLKIYEVALEMLTDLKPIEQRVREHDADLARQLQRAETSVVLNIAEGAGSRGGTARARFDTACGSTKEVRACLEAARALGYIERLDEAVMDRIDRIAATLFKLKR